MSYRIETRANGLPWTRYGIGEPNRFGSRQQVERTIDDPLWATAKYRVVGVRS